MGEVSDAPSGNITVSFDGRVLEVFGFSDTTRYHVRELRIETKGPDRKGRHDVLIGSRFRGGGAGWKVEEADWPQVGPVLDRAQREAEAAAQG